MLPPGDLRNCMVALSEEEALLARACSTTASSEGDALKGHNFGNLFVAALTEITGDFAQAVQLSSKILATRGRIYPATTANTTLVAEMDDGSFVRGETNITASHRRIVELTLDPPNPAPLPETMEAIERANLITVGPGSLYTSLITNLLVEGIPSALANARGLRVFICNLMTQANESLGLTASEHIERIYEHTRAPIFDCALVNTAPFSPTRWHAIRLKARRPLPPTWSATRRSAFVASPATLPVKELCCTRHESGWSPARSWRSDAPPFLRATSVLPRMSATDCSRSEYLREAVILSERGPKRLSVGGGGFEGPASAFQEASNPLPSTLELFFNFPLPHPFHARIK